MEYTFRIFRFDPQVDETPYFQDFFYETDEKVSVLEALMDIRNERDCSISMRYSCRESICGACAMVINGEFNLACRVEIHTLKSPLVVVEPLPNLEIQKDLVVDMAPFWRALSRVEPYLYSAGDTGEEKHMIEEEVMDEIYQYINCIMCGCCYSVCSVVTRDNRYLGPAAMAKLYRFVKDPRDKRPLSNLSRINNDQGLWGCDTIFRCNEVCPKNVRPADGIIGLRKKLVLEKIKQIFKIKK